VGFQEGRRCGWEGGQGGWEEEEGEGEERCCKGSEGADGAEKDMPKGKELKLAEVAQAIRECISNVSEISFTEAAASSWLGSREMKCVDMLL
jgi:hypothetical protein